ncbi:hypothetical protein [Clostridiisalibacter paucivorans]|uniref:hypothetical protein n=1 Tax=Clostridiisalibacter paucivorans TaxID=408753 RepID=UPI00047CF05E|nr:hypothetical protein [Clostridiisalibacter paucivorans]
MLKILKYDWISRWKLFLSGIIIGILLNIEIIRNVLNEGNSTKTMGIYGGILIFLIIGFGIALAIDHVRRVSKSLFTEEGYFLLSTPLNGYQVLGGKIITIILECIGIVSFIGLTLFIDYKFIINKFPEVERISEIPPEFMKEGFKFLVLILVGYITFMLMIYLSITLAKSIFSAIKYGKILSFVFFIIISKLISKLGSYLGDFTEQVIDSNIYENTQFVNVTSGYLLLNICIALVLFGLTGYLLDRKINI